LFEILYPGQRSYTNSIKCHRDLPPCCQPSCQNGIRR
jgi:hypothetical protein